MKATSISDLREKIKAGESMKRLFEWGKRTAGHAMIANFVIAGYALLGATGILPKEVWMICLGLWATRWICPHLDTQEANESP